MWDPGTGGCQDPLSGVRAGSPGLGVVDFGLDAPRFPHQWLPNLLCFEKGRLGPALGAALLAMGHPLKERRSPGCAQVILVGPDGRLSGAADRRWADSAAVTAF